ncbi:MAG TPA: SPFH domain-containing protein [Vicinamibacterales bacterium]|nr:SPFH domain-containing protein [Vicinamibacterales bacterium]
MVFLKYALLVGSAGLLVSAASVLIFDVLTQSRTNQPFAPRWRLATRLVLGAWLALLPALSIVVVPSGMAGVRVSQISGVLAGTLHPGTHFILPLVQRVELYNVRDQIFATNPAEIAKDPTPVLKVYSREGLPVGLGISVRYQLDPQKLPYVQSTLPQPVETEIMPPVVANAFRQTVSGYMVREVFSAKREEVRRAAADAITKRLAADGIVVKEVMLRDIGLPPEYAKGLEGLLLKAQENDRLSIELEVKQKMVRTAELEAEADKMRQVKHAEGRAQITVLEAKAQADAMQHTLPLKEKQIQQSRLEAEARKEATVKGAEAAAQAKVIDSKAELEKRNLMAQAEAQRIHLLAGADAERMRSEAQVLKDNPLLIQKIVAERLSDKVQIMMVPMDGKYFFTNDVLKMTPAAAATPNPYEQR